MIARLLAPFKRKHLTGAHGWERFRTGYVYGPYHITPNKGGGALASYNGAVLNDGRMLPDVATAQAFCEGHHAGLTTAHARNGAAMKQSAHHSLPVDFDDDCDGWCFDKEDSK